MTIDTTKGIAGLKGALRYVRAYRDHVFVVKLGGDVLSDPAGRDQAAAPARVRPAVRVPRSRSTARWCRAERPGRPRPSCRAARFALVAEHSPGRGSRGRA